MSSQTVSFLIFLGCAPVGMALSYWRGRIREERKAARSFADEVEFYMIVRKHGG